MNENGLHSYLSTAGELGVKELTTKTQRAKKLGGTGYFVARVSLRKTVRLVSDFMTGLSVCSRMGY